MTTMNRGFFKKTEWFLSDCQDDIRGLILIILLSAVVKLTVLLTTNMVNVDGTLYLNMAELFSQGRFREALGLYPMPFLPLVIVAVHYVIPDWVIAGQFVSLLALLGSTVPLYFITRQLLGSRAAFWGALGFALCPVLTKYAGAVVRDPLFLCFFAWGVWFALRFFEKERFRDVLAVFVFSGLAFLCRVEGLLLSFAFVSFLIVLTCCRRMSLRTLSLALGVPAALSGICLVAGLLVFDSGQLVTLRLDFVLENLQQVTNLRFLDNYRWLYSFLESQERTHIEWGMQQNFFEVSRHYLWFFYLFGMVELLIKVLFPLFVIPLWFGLRCQLQQKTSRQHAFVWVLFGTFFVADGLFYLLYNFLDTRYVLAPMILLFPWVGLGTSVLLNRIRGFGSARALSILLVVVFCLAPLGKSVKSMGRQDRAARDAGEWLATQPELKSLSIATTDPRIAYYAGYGSDFYRCKRGSLEEMAEEARSIGHDLFVLEISKKRLKTLPQLPHYQKLQEFTGRKNVAVIYRRNS